MENKPLQIDSFYFKIYELSVGIYAAMAKIEAGIASNAGFFEIGKHLIIFDTTVHPEATRELIQIASKLTSKNTTLVINSHAHGDHFYGNYVFPDEVPIISCPGKRKLSFSEFL